MRNLLLILFSLLCTSCLALDENLENIGIAKYGVLEVLHNKTPLRQEQNENSKRITHLYKNTVLFADKQTKDYYRIELEKDNFAWVNKKYVELQAVIPEKRFENIEEITFKQNKKNHQIEIKTPFASAFEIKEENNNLEFTLFDNHFDPTELNLSHNKHFQIEEKIDKQLKLKYQNDKNLFGYDVLKTEKGYTLAIKKTPKINKKRPLKNIKIVVDPGHGGCECGACAFKLKEKKLNLQISKKLKKELTKKGAKVYLTRNRDKKIELYSRIDFANKKNADILLSIHQNSLENRADIDKKHGVGTYYYHNQAKPLAQKIQENLLLATNFKNDNVNHASFALTRASMPVSVLIECGYIIKEDEAMQLKNKKFQRKIAKAITKGCEQYLKESFN